MTRWYLRRQLILAEIAQLEAQWASRSVPELAPEPDSGIPAAEDPAGPKSVDSQLKMAREKLKGLGHCPKPMMG
ncbi:MAG: hypothetical protein NVSMB44_18060 [Ktedonobacteraceae bacterium]